MHVADGDRLFRRTDAERVGTARRRARLHAYNVEGPVYDLATTASKFLHLGLSLEDVIAKVTSVPQKPLSTMKSERSKSAPGEMQRC